MRELDKSHFDFIRDMEKDPTIDKDLLHQNFPKNYSDALGLNRMRSRASLAEERETDPENILNMKQLDDHDRRRIK